MKKNSHLKYILAGTKGPVLVLLHAFPLNGKMYRAQIQALKKHMRVLVPDMPGFGLSKAVQHLTVPKMAFFVANLLDKLNIREPVILAGVSMGGYVALEFARAYPGRTKGLGLFATRAQADSPEQREKRNQTISLIQKKGLSPFAESMLQKVLGETTKRRRPAAVRLVKKLMAEASPRSVCLMQKALGARRDNTGHLPRLSCPALLIAGREDSLIPIEDMELLHKNIRFSAFHQIPGCGHLPTIESPAAVNKLLTAFVRSIR